MSTEEEKCRREVGDPREWRGGSLERDCSQALVAAEGTGEVLLCATMAGAPGLASSSAEQWVCGVSTLAGDPMGLQQEQRQRNQEKAGSSWLEHISACWGLCFVSGNSDPQPRRLAGLMGIRCCQAEPASRCC